MSSSEAVTKLAVATRRLAVSCAVIGVLSVQACTVRPLYSVDSTGTARTEVAALQQITIEAPDTREELEVRNHLIFLLNGGAGMPAQAPYLLKLGVTSRTTNALNNQLIVDPTENEGQPTAGIVTLQSSYTLTDAGTGEKIASGQRSVSADFDRPRQEFAQARAERNAQDRAARELAELLRLALAQDLASL